MQQTVQAAQSSGEAAACAKAKAPSGADDRYQRNGFNGLAAAKLIQRWAIDNRDMERAYQGTPGAWRDAQALIRPQATAVDMWLSFVGLPQAGRNLLQAQGWWEVRALG